MKKILFSIAAIFIGVSSWAQVELTPEEQAFQDSINVVNAANAATAESQEAYNSGIALFGQNKMKEAVASFDKAIAGDPKFEAAYYNKGVAQYKMKDYNGAVKTLSSLIKLNKSVSATFLLVVRPPINKPIFSLIGTAK